MKQTIPFSQESFLEGVFLTTSLSSWNGALKSIASLVPYRNEQKKSPEKTYKACFQEVS